MSLFVDGRIISLIILIVVSLVGIWSLEQAKKGRKIDVRPLDALLGIDETVRRCVETNRPVFFTAGRPLLYSSKGPEQLAGIGILSYLARKTAFYGAKLVTLFCPPELIPIAEQTIREAYMIEGKIDEVTSDMVLFLPGNPTVGYAGELSRQNAGGAVLAGAIAPSAAILLGEPGVAIGAMQIGGAVDMSSTAMLAAVCDYLFIGEELYVASAISSGDQLQLGVTLASDFIKITVLVLMFVGFLLSSIGFDVSSILSM